MNDWDWLRTPAKCWASVRLETCRTSVKAESISICCKTSLRDVVQMTRRRFPFGGFFFSNTRIAWSVRFEYLVEVEIFHFLSTDKGAHG